MLRRALPWLLVLTSLFAGRASFAQADEIPRLENELDAAFSALAEVTEADCGAACEALASMRRAAARICELDPGPPCEAARQKLEEATRRVREACPMCFEAELEERPGGVTADEPPRPAKKGGVEVDGETGEAEDAATSPPAPAEAPQAEQAGGCASCTVNGTGGAGSFLGLVLGLGLLAWRRRR